jgi:death-on-curing protein
MTAQISWGRLPHFAMGLIKNHPWVGGNKRTATALVNEFLYRNDVDLTANTDEIIEMVLAVEGDRWQVQEIDSGLRRNVANSHK